MEVIRGSALMALEGDKSEMGVPSVEKLMANLDQKVPVPKRDEKAVMMFSVDQTFNITGRGIVATGTVESGTIKVGDQVELVGFGKVGLPTSVTGVETFNKTMDKGIAGDNVGILLRGVKKEQVRRGMILAKPNSVKPITKFKANC